MFKKLIKKVKDYFQRKKNLKTSYQYYKLVQNGARFIQFIYNDIDKYKSTLNRETRRRFETELNKKGKLNMEMVTHYASKVDDILQYIEELEKTSKKKV
jgi:hypothetical protein